MKQSPQLTTILFIVILSLIVVVILIAGCISPESPPIPPTNNSNTSLNDTPSNADLIERFGAEDSNPTGSPIGGGAGYSDIFTPDDPRVTYIVNDRAQFLTVLQKAQPGDVIYINEEATIILTGTYFGVEIPSGVTIASNRGYEGSLGGRILQGRDGNEPTTSCAGDQSALKTGGDNIRITGLRLEGPDISSQELADPGVISKYGIIQLHKNLIVDNCEIYGWSRAGIAQILPDDIESTYGGYFHHNYIHHCLSTGFGYGILNDGTTLIEANFFDYCRHMITDDGSPGQFYEARYNIFGEHTGTYAQQVDVHPPGGWTNPQPVLGTTVYIHHNTFHVPTSNDDHIRIHPSYHTSYIDHNVFYWADPADKCVYVLYGYENIVVENNLYAGGSEVASDDSVIVRYFRPDWMPIYGRPIEPRPEMLPPLSFHAIS